MKQEAPHFREGRKSLEPPVSKYILKVITSEVSDENN
jgi:hypothetical protein